MIELDDLLSAIEAGDTVPFHFTIGGRPADCRLTSAREATGDLLCTYHVDGHPLNVKLRCALDPEHDLLRYSCTLSAANDLTQPVDDVRLLNLTVAHEDEDVSTTLRSITGGTVRSYTGSVFPPTMFRTTDRRMRGHDIAEFSDATGRGSNEHMPLWFYYTPDGGFWFGPEWQGTWHMELYRLPEYTFAAVEMQFLRFTMREGEELTLPTMALGTFRGDIANGCNALRRAVSEVYQPDFRGQPPEPQVVYQMLGSYPRHGAGDGLRREAEVAAEMGAEAFVFASSWCYDRVPPGESHRWWEKMGEYRPSEDVFPDGVRSFADFLRSKGMKLGLWIDPRVSMNTPEAERAEDLLLHFDPAFEEEARRRYNPLSYDINVQPLVDLSKPEGRAYLLETMERMVTEYGAEWIWYDLNTDPRPFFWQCNEEQDRRGLLELKYYQGMDQVMEEFLERHPDVWVEMCASGGRMINLGVLRYSHSLWITDYVGSDPDVAADIRGGANEILPANCVHQSLYLPPEVREGEAELPLRNVLAHFGGIFGISQNVLNWPEQTRQLVQCVAEHYNRLKGALAGDFYRLTPRPESRDAWEGWQFHDAETASGFVVLMRLSESTRDTQTVTLRGMPKDARPAIERLLGAAEMDANGTELSVRLTDTDCVLLGYGLPG